MGGRWREPPGVSGLCARPNLRRGGRGKRTHSLAQAAEQLNPERTAAGDLERKVIAISELAISAELQASTRGKGVCGSPGKEKCSKGTEGAGLKKRFSAL